MADEVTDATNEETVSLVITYVNSQLKVREVLMGFLNMERITGKILSHVIIDRLLSWGLQLECLTGQSYDGAANKREPKMGAKHTYVQKHLLIFMCMVHHTNLI